jgi:hypothetical protein
MGEKFSCFILTQNKHFNHPCKSCFNILQHQLNTVNYFDKMSEPNDCMFQALVATA